jgi:hypothetical protein
MAATRPNSASFWKSYLNYDDYTQSAVWEKIGGSIGKTYGPTNDNSCAARVSHGLNYSGAPVQQFGSASVNLKDQEYKGVKGDGLRYIVSAMGMAKYLKQEWENPDHQVKDQASLDKVVSSLGGKCAIFATPNPPGGQGHAGVLRVGYSDPFVSQSLPVDVWVLRQ